MSSAVPILVISLLRSTERRKDIAFQLSRLGLEYAFFDAVEGAALSEAQKNTIEQQRDRSLYRKPFSPGEIGCMMSHINVYKNIIDNEYDWALILEDDVFLTEDIKEFLSTESVSQFQDDWDIILLAFVQRGNIESRPTKYAQMSLWNRKRILNKYLLGTPIQFSFHTAGYLVSLKGAQKLLNAALPPRMPSDFLTGNALQHDINLKIIRAPLIRQQRKWALQSTIKTDNLALSPSQYILPTPSWKLPDITKRLFRYSRRLYSIVINGLMLCAKGHAFPIVMLRKLGIISPDKLP